jgi:hypothetical protein
MLKVAQLQILIIKVTKLGITKEIKGSNRASTAKGKESTGTDVQPIYISTQDFKGSNLYLLHFYISVP